jgi:hypothetical protein
MSPWLRTFKLIGMRGEFLSTPVFELPASEDQALQVGWDTLLVLNLRFHVVNGVGGFDFECNGLAGKSLHENLCTAMEMEVKVKGWLLLNVVVKLCAAILELFPSKDKMLLVRGDATFILLFRSYDKYRWMLSNSPFFALNLGLDIVNHVWRLNLKSDSLPGQGLGKDLHTTAQTKDQVKGGFFLVL